MSTTNTPVLVTGATGMVGASICRALASRGMLVRAMYRPGSGKDVFNRTFSDQPSLADAVDWVQGDITDVFSLRDAMHGVSEVYHAAAIVSFDPRDTERIRLVNTTGTANVVDMALDAGVGRLCHISSVAAIGRVEEDQTVDENVSWKNSSHNTEYARTKYAAEMEVWRGFEEGLQGVIINPTIILGPAAWSAGSGLLFKTVWEGLRFYPEGSNGFVDVRDVAEAAVRLMAAGLNAERFVLVAENLPYRQLFESIAFALGKTPPSIRITRNMAGIAWRMDRIKSLLTGMKPLITREMAHTSTRRWSYSNEKVRAHTGMDFISVEQSAKHWAAIFLETYSEKSAR